MSSQEVQEILQNVRSINLRLQAIERFLLNSHEIYISLKDAAKLTGYSENSLYKKVERGQIPASKVGGLWKFPKNELLKWMYDQNKSRFSLKLEGGEA